MKFFRIKRSKHSKKCSEKATVLGAFLLLVGALFSHFAVSFGSFSNPAYYAVLGFPVVLFAAIALIIVFGFCVIGRPFVLLMDFAVGAVCVYVTECCINNAEPFSAPCLLQAAVAFFIVFSTLAVSSAACRFSKIIFEKVYGDSELKRLSFRYSASCLGLLLIIISALILFNGFNAGLFI